MRNLKDMQFKKYLLSVVCEESQKETPSKTAKSVLDAFQAEDSFNGLNATQAVSSWLQGLPSTIDVAFTNCDIIEHLESFGYLKATAKAETQEKAINEWFLVCADKLIKLSQQDQQADKTLMAFIRGEDEQTQQLEKRDFRDKSFFGKSINPNKTNVSEALAKQQLHSAECAMINWLKVEDELLDEYSVMLHRMNLAALQKTMIDCLVHLADENGFYEERGIEYRLTRLTTFGEAQYTLKRTDTN